MNITPSLNLDFASIKRLDPRITFTNASANRSYFDASGTLKYAGVNEPRFDHDPSTGESLGLLVEEARTNLLTYSEQFDNAAWTKANSTVTANTITAPDGTLTADKLIVNNGSAFGYLARLSLLQPNTTYTLSFYAKAGEVSVVYPDMFSSETSDVQVTINLLTGVASSPLNSPDGYGAIPVGNGWYRCWITKTFGAALTSGQAQFGRQQVTGDGTSGLYIWGAQLEAGAFPTSYIPSSVTFTSRASAGSFIGSNGLIQSATTNTARYSYNPSNLSIPPKLLLEEARTNLLTYSEQFDNAAWPVTNANISATANTTTAPDGTVTADTITTSLGGTDSRIRQGAVVANDSTTYTVSCFVKRVASEATARMDLRLLGGTTQLVYAYVLSFTTLTLTGVSGGSVASATSVQSLGDGWYRISVTGANNSSGNVTAQCSIAPNAATDGSFNIGSIYYWGAQLEAGAYPTSYIQTVAAQVTRAADVSTSAAATRSADVASMTGTNFSSWYSQTEGTFVTRYLIRSDSSVSIFPRILECSDGTFNNYMAIFSRTIDDTNRFAITTGGVGQGDLSLSTITYGSLQKIAAAYKLNDVAASANSASVVVAGVVSIPTVATMYIGSQTGGAQRLNGHIARITYFPRRLSNSNLQALST